MRLYEIKTKISNSLCIKSVSGCFIGVLSMDTTFHYVIKNYNYKSIWLIQKCAPLPPTTSPCHPTTSPYHLNQNKLADWGQQLKPWNDHNEGLQQHNNTVLRKKQSTRRGFTWLHPGRWSQQRSWLTHRQCHPPPCPRRRPGSWWRDRPWRSRDPQHQHLENRLDTHTEPWYTGAILE